MAGSLSTFENFYVSGAPLARPRSGRRWRDKGQGSDPRAQGAHALRWRFCRQRTDTNVFRRSWIYPEGALRCQKRAGGAKSSEGSAGRGRGSSPGGTAGLREEEVVPDRGRGSQGMRDVISEGTGG